MNDSKHSSSGSTRKRKQPSPEPNDRKEEEEEEEEEDDGQPSAKRPRQQQDSTEEKKWPQLSPDDLLQRALIIAKSCHEMEAKANKGQLDPAEIGAFTAAIPMFYDWLSGNFILACRLKINTRSAADEKKGETSDDVVDVSEEERHEGAPLRLSMLELVLITITQCLYMIPEKRKQMHDACVRFEETCLRLRKTPRISVDEKSTALQHRLRREIFTFHHAWRSNIDYALVAKAQMRSHSDLYEFEMTERELTDFYKRNPQYLAERERLDGQPKPYLYRDQIHEAEMKANPVLKPAWDLSRDDLIWLCASQLRDVAGCKLDRTMCDFVHACSWFLFHANFCDQLWKMYDSVPLTQARETALNRMRIRMIANVTESLSFDRDAETRDSSEGIAFRLTAPVGTNEYFVGNHAFDVDRHHVKLQRICNWLEPTKLLQEAWLASLRAVGDVLPIDALLSHAGMTVQSAASASASASASAALPDILGPEVHFYQSFATLLRFLCNVDLEDHVMLGADVMARYTMLMRHRDCELPEIDTRPQIICFARRSAVRMGKTYYSCTYLWQACLLWLSLLEEHFYGELSDGKTVHKLARRLGLQTTQAPRPSTFQRVYGGPLPAVVGGSSESIEDQGGRAPPSPVYRPAVAAAAAADVPPVGAAAAAAAVRTGSLNDVD